MTWLQRQAAEFGRNVWAGLRGLPELPRMLADLWLWGSVYPRPSEVSRLYPGLSPQPGADGRDLGAAARVH